MCETRDARRGPSPREGRRSSEDSARMNELARALAVGQPVGQIFQADRRFPSVLITTLAAALAFIPTAVRENLKARPKAQRSLRRKK